MSQINKRWPIIAILMSLLLAVAGCSSSGSGSTIDPDTGKHPDNWIEKHQNEFIKSFLSNPAKCEECHGSDPVFKGGISKVSCFNASCHNSSNGAPIGHPNTPSWNSPESHGARAKMAPGDESGFSFCQVCHGTNNAPFFGGGVFGPTCFLGCHGPAPSPHPNAWLPDDAHTHTTTDPGNAPVCADCHFHQKNLPADAAAGLPPFTPAPNGTPPGCFNNTLCHGANVAPASHDQANWVVFSPLGADELHGDAAKGAPGPQSGFSYCQACHAVDFTGNGAGVSCVNTCHGAASPHPPDWLITDLYHHSTTDAGNAPVCNQCHFHQNNLPADAKALLTPFVPAPAGTPPGCFNNTLCHGANAAPASHDQANWVVFSPPGADELHGDAAKGAPGSQSGFTYCQACHAVDFTGNGAGVSCVNTCHGAASPHPPDWLPGDLYTHTTANSGNAPVCNQCHFHQNNLPADAKALLPPFVPAPPGTPPGCFNNTLCH